jgi:plasmid maintenance system antidote protein VapI
MRFRKINLTLPSEVHEKFTTLGINERNDYITALRRAGWTLQSISEATGVTRERVRQIVATNTPTILFDEVPLPPVIPEKMKPVYVEPSEKMLTRLRELRPLAAQVRGTSPAFRAEGEEYSRLLNEAHTVEGVTIYRLAKRLGVTPASIRFRLARYGYMPPFGGDSGSYRLLKSKS